MEGKINKKKGYLLVDMVLALALISILFLGIGKSYSTYIKNNYYIKEKIKVAEIINSLAMELKHNISFEDLRSINSGTYKISTLKINDLINRYKIKKVELFKSLVNFILQSNSRIISAKSIHDYIKHSHESCSINTIIKYIGYLEEAYIIEKIKTFSTKKKNELKYYYKVYDEDVAFNSLKCTDGRYDLTHNLENIVYNELIYIGYDLSVYNDDNKEVDFLAQKDGKKYYIQVAYSLEDEKTYNREFIPFANLDNTNKKIIYFKILEILNFKISPNIQVLVL